MPRIPLLLLATASAFAASTSAQSLLASTYTGSSGLNDAAKSAGKYMGTATDIYSRSGMSSDTAYMNELKNGKDWGMLTCANVMKWSNLQPTQGKFDYSRADQVVTLGKGIGASMRCHALVWHQQAPSWISSGSLSNASMLSALTDHITTVMTHFKDDCYAWDVVNEVVSDSGGYRDSFWYQKTGASYIAHAFNVANQVKQKLGLKTKLYYNDYNIESASSAKTKFALSMVKNLLAQGVKVDGVGLQSHFTVGQITQSGLASVMNSFTALGVEVAVTELDIKVGGNPSTANQQQQAKDYAAVAGACKAVSKCVGVTVWDFVDTYSWISNGAALPWYQPNGANSALVRKIAYDGLLSGWGGAVSTSTSTTTTKPTTTAATTKPTTSGGAEKWAQCGGIGWTGATTCKEGTCVKLNDYYLQCQ